MDSEQTIIFIKPRAIEEDQLGNIINLIIDAKVKIIGMKMMLIPMNAAGTIFKKYSGTPLYEVLVKELISGPSVVAVLQGKKLLSWLPLLMQLESKVFPLKRDLNYINSSFLYRPDNKEEALELAQYMFAGFEIQDL